MQKNIVDLKKTAKLIRYLILKMTTSAGSGHPTTAMSAVDLLVALFDYQYHYDFDNPDNPFNDRLIFSKGHATPLYYSLFALSGAISIDKLDAYRQFDSTLEGHPTPRFKYTEAATGSLGQGLSVGVGFALNSRYLDKISYKIYVLLGDGEMAEGSVWEALEIASQYRLDNLIGILDVNRLGQSGETMIGHDLSVYKKRIESFGWHTEIIDGHDFSQILKAYELIGKTKSKPFMIIAKTRKGKGVSFVENKNNWHGKPLNKELFQKAVKELGEIDFDARLHVSKPRKTGKKQVSKLSKRKNWSSIKYKKEDTIPTRKAYGNALARVGEVYPQIVALDADVKNSTYSEIFKDKFPDRFFDMYIAEQNMVGTAVGLSRREKVPFVSTFAAFFTRAFDQIRMAALSQANIKYCGSHAGVSIGEDGPSQMGLEDLAMFKSIFGSRVFYPSDAVSTEKLVEQMVVNEGVFYLRTTRGATPVIYENSEKFKVGGSKIHSADIVSDKKVIIIAAGITLFEAFIAQKNLANRGIEATVVDCYSIKPIDSSTLKKLTKSTQIVITVEDHWTSGGLGDSVLEVFHDNPAVKVYKLAVNSMPKSGKGQELLKFANIDSEAIEKQALALF